MKENSSFIVCKDILSKDNVNYNYTYKDGCYHTRLKYLSNQVVIRGFEDKLAFLTSLMFCLYSSVPATIDYDSDWKKVIREFKDSPEYRVIKDALNTTGIEFKDIKVLKPYQKNFEVKPYEFVNSYHYLVRKMYSDLNSDYEEGREYNSYIDAVVSKNILNMSIRTFLFNDSVSVIITENKNKIDNSKFDRKHQRKGLEISLWD